MRNPKQIYTDILLSEYEDRRKRNPSYSLRAFARFLGLESGTLSGILKGTRPIPRKDALVIVEKLSLSPIRKKVFLECAEATSDLRKLLRMKPSKETLSTLLDDQIALLAHWEHLAVLALLETKEALLTPETISRRLGIPAAKTNEILDELFNAGLLEKPSRNRFKPSKLAEGRNTATPNVTSARILARQSLDLARQKFIEDVEHLSYFGSNTLAISKSRILEAQELLIEFRKRLCCLLETGEKDEVYMFNIQLFPLTTNRSNTS